MNNFNSHNNELGSQKNQDSADKKALRSERVAQVKGLVGAMIFGVGIGISIGMNMPANSKATAPASTEEMVEYEPNTAEDVSDVAGTVSMGERCTSEGLAAQSNERCKEETASNVDTLYPVDYDRQTVEWGYTVWQTVKDTESDIENYNENHPHSQLSGNYDDQTIMDDIQRANPDKDLNKLNVGDTIIIPDYTPDDRDLARQDGSVKVTRPSETDPAAENSAKAVEPERATTSPEMDPNKRSWDESFEVERPNQY